MPTLRIYDQITLEGTGWQAGHQYSEVYPISVTGTFRVGGERGEDAPVAPSTQHRVWYYTENPDGFDFYRVQVRGAGSMWLTIWVDTPTSANDITPSGNNRRMVTFELQNGVPFYLGPWRTKIHPTIDTDRGLTSGNPTKFETANLAALLDGYIYGIFLWHNASAAQVRRRQVIK